MAQKRMFSLSVVDTDKFMDMPASTQALYFHLGMHGDDDGFVSSPKKIARAVGCGDDDLRLLAAKGFIIPFDSGVVVITDWKINNTIKSDRYKETIYIDEKANIHEEKSGRYALGTSVEPLRNQNGSTLEPQYSVDKDNVVESGADKPPARSRFVPPKAEEVRNYCTENGYPVDPNRFIDFYTANGWTQGRGKKIKDWRACVRTWVRREKAECSRENQSGPEYVVDEKGVGSWILSKG